MDISLNMKKPTIHQVFHDSTLLNQDIIIHGWVRTVRKQKNLAFLSINDGSTLANIQIVIDRNTNDAAFEILEKIQTGACIKASGILKDSPGKQQSIELQAHQIEILGQSQEDFVLQKKHHSLEFLRSIPHLRPRTKIFGAIMRIRNSLAYATHKFFHEQDFVYVQTPIITSSDCEGSGELFTVTTLDLSPSQKGSKTIDFQDDFFGRRAFLTVSGQLNGEAYALALSRIYTFGPTFRAENSNTSRHLAEFWMIEPEMAFFNLSDLLSFIEEYWRYLLTYLLEKNSHDVEFLQTFHDNDLLKSLQDILQKKIAHLSYTESVEILQKSHCSFTNPVQWGLDLQSEHEKFLTEKYISGPLFIYNYPKDIKPFYMRINGDRQTVAATDFLVPKIGELIGGSQREERLDVLQQAMEDKHLCSSDYSWYLDLRRFGSAPHSGFGLGFERLVQYCTGMDNIRDVIPFPRYPKHAYF